MPLRHNEDRSHSLLAMRRINLHRVAEIGKSEHEVVVPEIRCEYIDLLDRFIAEMSLSIGHYQC